MMKKKTKLIMTAGLAAFAGITAYAVKKNAAKEIKVALPKGCTVTAHTGCEKTAANSLEAIRRGYESGADIVEFDLNFACDGTPVLSHDEPEAGAVLLDDAFAVVAEYDRLKVNVDCKKTTDLKAVEKLSEKHGIRDRIFYTGIEEKDVPAVREQTPDVMYYLNVKVDKRRNRDRMYLKALADKVEALGAVGINMKYTACSKELVSVFDARGLLVSVWTVNSASDMKKMLSLAPDNITTKSPSQLKGLMG